MVGKDLSTKENREFWSSVAKTAREVRFWPSWKRVPRLTSSSETDDAYRAGFREVLQGGWLRHRDAEPEKFSVVANAIIKLLDARPLHDRAMTVPSVLQAVVTEDGLCDDYFAAAVLIHLFHGEKIALLNGWCVRLPLVRHSKHYGADFMGQLLGFDKL